MPSGTGRGLVNRCGAVVTRGMRLGPAGSGASALVN